MKNYFKMLGIIAIAAVIGFLMVSCGSDDPKALAKQSYDLAMQAVGAIFNPSEAANIAKKTVSLEEKVAKLSASDKAIYDQELARLAGNTFGGLLNTGSDLLNSSQDALNAAQKALDSLNVQDTLNATQQALDSLNNLNVQDSLNSAQKALDVLNSFGF